MAAVRDTDPKREALAAVLAQWEAALGTASEFTIQQIISRASIAREFNDALCMVAEQRGGGSINVMRLGRYLNQNQGKIVNGLTLRRTGIVAGFPYWRLVRIIG
jgi:hypothetical protein